MTIIFAAGGIKATSIANHKLGAVEVSVKAGQALKKRI
jgi:hypothetical protein